MQLYNNGLCMLNNILVSFGLTTFPISIFFKIKSVPDSFPALHFKIGSDDIVKLVIIS